MASGPYQRKSKWQIKWREAGRGSAWQSESFDFEHDAHVFKYRVEQAGNAWPRDENGNLWIKGVGFLPQQADDEAGTPFLPYAKKYVRGRLQAGKIQPDTSAKYMMFANQIAGALALAPLLSEKVEADDALHLAAVTAPMLARPILTGLIGNVSDEEIAKHADQVAIEDLDAEAIRAYIFYARVRPWRTSGQGPGHSWKTIRNYHGLLHGVLEQAFMEDLIRRNPTKITARLLGTEPVLEKVVLTPAQFGLIHSCMHADQKDFIEAAVGTGARFGELTAARKKNWDSATKCLRIEEAWKRGLPGQGFYVGPPKTKAGIRDVYVSGRVAEILDQRVDGKDDHDLIFTAARGGRVRQNTFCEERWQVAVNAACKKGLTVRPRFHDLRHTHVSWLRAGGLMNEVIKTFVGHTEASMTEKYGEVPVAIRQAAASVIDQNLLNLVAA